MSKTNLQISNDSKMQNPIVVAMSGGVDSSVAAALMKKKTSNVMGVTLKLYEEKKVKNFHIILKLQIFILKIRL